MDEIEVENEFIKGLVDLIPPRLYFDAESWKKINVMKHAHVDKYKQLKEKKSKMGKSKKQLRARLDPEIPKTVSDLQHVLGSAEENVKFPGAACANGDASDIKELKDKLSARLTELRGKRKHTDSTPGKKEKNRAKKQRVKLKAKRNFTPLLNGGNNRDGSPTAEEDAVEIEFGKLAFSEEPEKKRNPFGGSNYKHMLQKVKKSKERLEKLQERDEGKANEVIKAKAWETAMMKAKGIKIKDDVGMLKKAARKQASKAKKSKKDWQEREGNIRRQQEKKQNRRKANIATRKKEKIEKKIKKSIKKGRMIQ